jgi:hypothetical protein
MEGQEIAFLLMMGFSCLVGIFVGYLMFSPRRSTRREDEFSSRHDFEDEADTGDMAAQIDPDTVPAREPWLTDKETLRAQARERAMARMTEHAKRVHEESDAARRATAQPSRTGRAQSVTQADGVDGMDDSAQPYFDPETIKEWDQVSPKRTRRRPGTWVKATTD